MVLWKPQHRNWRVLFTTVNVLGGANKYAIIATGGKQYKVSEGDIINVELLGVNACDK